MPIHHFVMSNRIIFLVMRKVILSSLTAGVALIGLAAAPKLFPILKSKASIGKQAGGFYLLPTNQLLQPWGEQSKIKGRPVDAALDPSKRLLAVLNNRDIDIFDASTSTPLGTMRAASNLLCRHCFPPRQPRTVDRRNPRNGPDSI